MEFRMKLEDLVLDFVKYELHVESKLKEEEKYFLEESYKREAVKKMSTAQLIDIIMCRPTVLIRRENGCLISDRLEISPLTNITFTRDQQITTARGVVIGNLSFSPRVCCVIVIYLYIYYSSLF
jgi:arginine deiminase